jgi:predicted porin
MKLKTFALSSLAVACLSVTNPVVAEDEWVDVYGKIMITLDKVDEDNGDDQWEVNSNASRIGVKGKGAAGDGIEAFYQMEWEVDMADEGGADSNFKSRNQIVGLRGNFGEVFAGRHDTPTKALQKKIDIFGDLTGDIKHSFNGEVRADNIVQYTTPKMSGLKIKAAFIPGENSPTNDGLADATSIAFEYKTGDLNLGLSFDSDVENDGVDSTRLMAQYKMKAWQFGFMYQMTDNNFEIMIPEERGDGSGMMASAKYTAGKNTFKIQLVNSDLYEVGGVSAKVKYDSQTSLGWDRMLGKKTTVFTYLTLSEEGDNSDSDSVFGVGIVQKF